MDKFEIKEAVVTSVGERSVDRDGVKSIMLRDESYFVTSMSMRNDADVSVDERFILIVDNERKQPFALYSEEKDAWLFSTQSESYDRWPGWAIAISALPFASLFVTHSILESKVDDQWALLYANKTFERRRKIYLAVSIAHVLVSAFAFLGIYLDLFGWLESAEILLAHAISSVYSSIRYDSIYKDLYESNLSVAESKLLDYLRGKHG